MRRSRSTYLPRRLVPAHDIPTQELMRGRIHAYRDAGGDVVFARSALHRRDTACPACPACRRWTDR